jgi:hypothetical protein
MSSTQSIWSKIMRKIILLCTSLCAMVLLISAGPARAQNVLWVGPTGNDINACSETAPCATFQGAINKGSVSQINCLGSGLYGSITITTSLTIDCGAGNMGNIVAANNGIGITGSGPVVLRHLSLNGLGNAAGIVATMTGTLIVEDCMIHGYYGGPGIFFAPTGGRGLLQVSNSQIFDNADGIVVSPGSGQIASVTLNQVELVANLATGLNFNSVGVVAGTMRGSVVGENGTSGVSSNAGQVFFTVEESSIVDNLHSGIVTKSPGSLVNVGASTIGGNGIGVQEQSGSIISFGNNQMSANGTNGTFTSTTALQ